MVRFLEWTVIAIAMVPSIPKPNHCESEQMAAFLFGFPIVLDKMANILFKTEHHWKTDSNWNSLRVRYSSPHCTQLNHCWHQYAPLSLSLGTGPLKKNLRLISFSRRVLGSFTPVFGVRTLPAPIWLIYPPFRLIHFAIQISCCQILIVQEQFL